MTHWSHHISMLSSAAHYARYTLPYSSLAKILSQAEIYAVLAALLQDSFLTSTLQMLDVIVMFTAEDNPQAEEPLLAQVRLFSSS